MNDMIYMNLEDIKHDRDSKTGKLNIKRFFLNIS